MRCGTHLFILTISILLAGCQSIPNRQSEAHVQPALPMAIASAPESPLKPIGQPDLHLDEQYSEVSTAPDDLWELTRRNLQLSQQVKNPAVLRQIAWFQQYPKHMEQVGKRAAPFYYYILHRVLERGLPAELALIPMIESGYNPFAYSSGHAAGLWQFIPSTANYLGIRNNRWYDGRKDVIESTEVALNYLERLHTRFKGNWLLAIAAYNAGGGTISKAIRSNKAAGKPTDFWSLSLAQETRLYIPRLLATAEFVRAPSRYHMPLYPIKNEPYFETITTGGPINITQAAHISGVEVDTLRVLNAGLLEQVTDPSGSHPLIVPIEHAPAIVAALDDLRLKESTVWVEYKIRKGDTLSAIAKRYHTQIKVIKQTNQLASNHLSVGKVLLIPQAETLALAQSSASTATKQPSAMQQHIIQSGDTLWDIARHYEVSVKQLQHWNPHVSMQRLPLGKPLNITPPSPISSASPGKRIGYTVQRGDSLYEIADRYRVTVADICQWNNLNQKGLIKAGQNLTLFVD